MTMPSPNQRCIHTRPIFRAVKSANSFCLGLVAARPGRQPELKINDFHAEVEHSYVIFA